MSVTCKHTEQLVLNRRRAAAVAAIDAAAALAEQTLAPKTLDCTRCEGTAAVHYDDSVVDSENVWPGTGEVSLGVALYDPRHGVPCPYCCRAAYKSWRKAQDEDSHDAVPAGESYAHLLLTLAAYFSISDKQAATLVARMTSDLIRRGEYRV